MEFEHGILALHPEGELINQSKQVAVDCVKGIGRARWFNIQEWEKSGAVYSALGVKLFKRYNPLSGDNSVFTILFGGFLTTHSHRTLNRVSDITKAIEAVHALGVVMFGAKTVSELQQGNIRGAIGMTAANILINVYPIMLQRYNRSRVERIRERFAPTLH